MRIELSCFDMNIVAVRSASKNGMGNRFMYIAFAEKHRTRFFIEQLYFGSLLHGCRLPAKIALVTLNIIDKTVSFFIALRECRGLFAS